MKNQFGQVIFLAGVAVVLTLSLSGFKENSTTSPVPEIKNRSSIGSPTTNPSLSYANNSQLQTAYYKYLDCQNQYNHLLRQGNLRVTYKFLEEVNKAKSALDQVIQTQGPNVLKENSTTSPVPEKKDSSSIGSPTTNPALSYANNCQLQTAYYKYLDCYNQYSNLQTQGKLKEAKEFLQEVNEAKSAFDQLNQDN